MSLKQKTIAGVAWSSGARLVAQVLQFGIMIVLIRLLAPEDFGLVAMAMVFVGFAQIFSDLGFGAALIQHRGITASHISSVFWLNVALGGGLLAVFYGAAPHIARFYETPGVTPLVRVLGLTFVLAALGTVPQALLQRAMTFKAIAVIEVVSVATSGALAVGLALGGWGVWSLVAQHLARQAARGIGAWLCAEQRPQFRFAISAVRDVFGFSLGYSGFNFINYWARKSDDLLIGKFIGSYSLGIYDRAYQLMLFPITQIISVIRKVMFPAFSSIQHDTDRIRRIYLRTMGLLALIIFPLMLGLFVVAEPFVLALFGARWAEAVPIIQVLCFVALTQTLSNPTGWIYTSQGRTDWMFWWGVFAAGTLIVAIVIGVTFGTVQAVAVAYLIANVALIYPCIALPGRLIDMSFAEVVGAVAGPLTCAGLMAAAVWSLGLLLPTSWTPLPRLALLVPSGVVIYSACVLLMQPAAYATARTLLAEQIERRKALSGEKH